MRSSSLPLAVLLALLIPTISSAQIVVNEIMYVPAAPEPEWVELYNASDTAVAMIGWTVQDRTTAKPTIPATVIPAKGYLLLTRDTNALRNARVIGSAVVQVSVPSLNNTGDDVIIRDASGRTIDSVSWSSSWSGTGGVSLERITAKHPGNERDSWRSAVDTTGATPGRRNSVAPAGRDLALRSVSFDPDTKDVRAVIVNVGADRSVGATVSLYHDADGDSAGTPDETQGGRSIPQIDPDDSTVVLLRWNRPLTVEGEPGLVVVDHPEDERPQDNRSMVLVREKFVDTGIVVNEFIYAPAAPEPEWIELFNRGRYPVDLSGWILHDAGAARPKIGSVIVRPGEYLVLTKDTAELLEARNVFSPLIQFPLPSLNNSGDNIVLRNRSGVAVDSIAYRSSWGGSGGRSVERRSSMLDGNDSSSWGSCIDPANGTPGKRNSLVPPEYNLSLNEPTFDVDSRTVSVRIVNTGMLATSGGSLFLYHDENRNGLGEASEERARFDPGSIASGRSIDAAFQWGRPLTLEGEAGLLLLELEGDERPGDDTARFVVRQPTVDTGMIVNEAMYDPDDPEPEWIELYNRGKLPVDLSGWRIADGSGSSGPLPGAIVLPGGYVVVTPDTAALLALRAVPSQRIRLLLPAFNNSGDAVVLRNPSGQTIDSFRYASNWGGRDGVSLERKAFDLPSADPASWTSAADSAGATPGARNSWEPLLHDLAAGSIAFRHDPPEVSAVVRNLGLKASEATEAILHFDENGNGAPDPGEELSRVSIPPIPSNDSTSIAIGWPRPLTEDGQAGLIDVLLPSDQRPANNVGTFLAILPPLDTGVVVNEIMYDPESPEPEWIELYNRTSRQVKLKGWTLQDGSTSRAELPDVILRAGAYVVITSDTLELRRRREVPATLVQLLHPAFNNGGDRVLLRNPSGGTVDEFNYTSSWGGKDGISLERKSAGSAAHDPSNWRSSSDPAGATPGRRNSASLPVRNIALLSVGFDPASSTITAHVANTGDEPASAVEAILYHDADGNGLAEPMEELIRAALDPVQPFDSTLLTLQWPRALTAEGEPGIVELVMPGDAEGDDNIATFLARTLLADSGIVINEVMYAPAAREPEWIELFNAGILPVDLAGWSVADAGAARAVPDAIMEPGTYLLLATDSTALHAAREVRSRILQFSLPSLNNAEDALVLRNGAGATADSLYYYASWGGSGGRSLERRRPGDAATDSGSWRSSIDSTGATPGSPNSVLPPDRNLALDSIGFSRTTMNVFGTIRNAGNEEVVEAGAILYHDRNENNLGEGSEEIGRTNVPLLMPDEENDVTLAWPRLLTDEGEPVILEVIAAGDLVDADNRRALVLYREPHDTGLVITEIMFDPIPVGELAGAEYMEVYNPDPRPVPLAGWSVADGSGREKRVPQIAPVVEPGRFAVIAGDSTIYRRFPFLADSTNVLVLNADLGFNNAGDDAILRNPSGRTIDSVRFDEAMHWSELDDTRGIALERIALDGRSNDPRNWSSSVAKHGGTPGAPNSRAVPVQMSEAELAASPSRVSPDGDGYEDFTRISYTLPVSAARVVVSIHDRRGMRVARPLNNELSSAEGSFIWDGTDDDGLPLPIGIYVVRIEAYDAEGGNVRTAQTAVTVARRL